MWIGALICLIWVALVMVVIVATQGWPRLGGSPTAVRAEQSTEFSPVLPDRTACAEFGSSDLRSPTEGVWFQRNCTGSPASDIGGTTACNRTSPDPTELKLVAPGLYVYRQTPASRAYLWHSNSESCFRLVSSRVVTVVCSDQTVSFNWGTDACSAHGGVLATVNGR